MPGVVGCISRICLLVVGYRQVQLSGSVVASQLSYLNKVMVSHLQFVLSVDPATFTAGTEGWGQELLHALCHVLCAKTFYFGSFTPTTKMPNLNGIEKGVSDRLILHTIMLMSIISTETGFMSMPSAQWKTLRTAHTCTAHFTQCLDQVSSK